MAVVPAGVIPEEVVEDIVIIGEYVIDVGIMVLEAGLQVDADRVKHAFVAFHMELLD